MKTGQNAGRQLGFSLVELLVVMAIMMVVMGGVFGAIDNAIERYQTEEQRLDITQQAREFLDQIVRDLHSTGYPNARMYDGGGTVLGPQPYNNSLLSAGLVAVSNTDIWLEGDLDGTGTVQSIRYTLQTNSNGRCPCGIQRSAVRKQNGVAPTAQPVSYNVELENLVNSVGSNGTPYSIDGQTSATSDDALFAAYKTAPVFAYLDENGAELSVPPDLRGSNLNTGEVAAANVKMVSVVLNLLSSQPDPKTKVRQSISVRAIVKMNNL